MSLRDTFSKLKTSIVGTKTSGIDAKLDSAVRDIISYKTNSGRNGYIDLVKSLISKGGTMDIGQNIFQQGTTPATFGQGGRLSRYNAYSAILSHINYCQRALDVLTDNILAPDDITKTSLEVNPKSFIEDSENAQSNVKDVEEIIQKIKLEDRLDMIVKSTLTFGDFFVEIADEKTALTSKSAFLAETIYHIQNRINDSSKETISEQIDENKNVKIIMDFSALDDIINNDKTQLVSNIDKKNKKSKLKPEDLQLLFYDPKRVVKLQSDIFPICFGYLIFPASIMSPQTMLQNQAVNSICQSILKSVEKKIPGLDNQSINTKDLQDIVSTMIKETDFTKAMNIRYVPPDRIQHFQRPSTKYYPYGESIFDSSQFGAKVLIALETAMTILRLNRSIEKRKISVEIGLPRDAASAIENLKEEFKRRKVSLDSFGSVDTIPSQISSFEDIFIPQKDGKAFVDISNMTDLITDTRSKTDELKFIRDGLVSSYGVPPAFIGIEENSCLLLNTYIPLINGNELSLQDIINQYDKGVDDMYVFSYDHETGKLAPGKIIWAGKTRLQTKIIRVHLDNDKYIDCTEDHLFMIRDGSYTQAKDLKENDSLMPFYTKDTKCSVRANNNLKLTYEYVYHPDLKNKNWQLVYHMVDEFFNGIKEKGIHVHHLDYNPRNNHPKNLKRVTPAEHFAIHGKDKCRHENNGTLYIEEKCIICGKLFKRGFSSNQITCNKKVCLAERKRRDGIKSWEARKSNYYEIERSCFICGKKLPNKTVHNSYSDASDRYYSIHCCDNPNCKSRIIAVSKLTKQGTKLFSNIEFRNCDICNELYIYSEEKIKRKIIILTNICGKMKCNNTILARRAAESKRLKAKVDLICPICGVEFSKPKYYVDSLTYPATCNNKECVSKNLSNIQTEKNKQYHIKTNCIVCKEEFNTTVGRKNTVKYLCYDKKSCKQEVLNIIKLNHHSKLTEDKMVMNHKVVRIEILEGLHDTGDITVERFSNFALSAGIIVHNSVKATLSEENVMFARTIVNHQKYLTHQVQDLIIKIYNILDPEKALNILDDVEIAFPSPKSLQFERQASYLSNLANLVETLERVGIPKDWSKKKYLSSIDWVEVEQYEIDTKIDKNLGTDKDEEPGGLGGGGLMSGGMGGF